MKVKLNVPLKEMNGEPMTVLKEEGSTEKVPALANEMLASATMKRAEGSEKEKLELYDLAMKVYAAKGEIDLTPKQAVELLKSVEKYPVIYVGQLAKLLS